MTGIERPYMIPGIVDDGRPWASEVFFGTLDALVPYAKTCALRWVYNGKADQRAMHMIAYCTHKLKLSPEHGAIIIFTRDNMHHAGGWFRNPDYEQCLHLSISYRVHHVGEILVDGYLPQQRNDSEKIAKAFFGDDAKLTWCEPPYSTEGKEADVWHYRLFCDPGWNPIKPRGEVYSKRNTPAEWKSFSEIHGYKPDAADAPFFARSSE